MRLRTIVFWGVVAIIVYWVIQDPAQAGGLVHNVVHGLGHAANSGSTVLNSISNGSGK